jgi:hypothetical protein
VTAIAVRAPLRGTGLGAGRPVIGIYRRAPPHTEPMMNRATRPGPRLRASDASQMKHADALTLQARHSPFVVVTVQRLYGRYMVDSRVMPAYGQNRGASDGGK